MNTIKKQILTAAAVLALLSGGCTDRFTEYNTDIRTIYEVEPERFLYNVQASTSANGWEWYYDCYLAQMRWLQYGCRSVGNTLTTFTYSNSNIWRQRYENSFMTTGSYMRHMEYLAARRPDSARYAHAVEAARVTLICQSICTSDVHGSLAYTQGWSLRSGGSITEPEFETQETLFGIWDGELKTAIDKFRTATGQVSIANYDMAFRGDMTKWIKTANALRLRLALRLMKRDMNRAKAIAAEVLASADIPSSTDDSFVIWLSGKETNHGDFEAINDLIRPSITLMDYMKKYNDPRKRMFFRANSLTAENVARWDAANPGDRLDEYGRYEGGTSDYDALTAAKWVKMYRTRSMDGTNMSPLNYPQTRIFSGMYDGGSGGTWWPKLTCADFCFMAAEFVLEGVASARTAEQWYTDGVRSSLELWNRAGDFCKIHDYEAMTPGEINTFMSQDSIRWDASIGRAQIYAQSYIEHFKNINESHALYRRTGYPNPSSPVVANEVCKVDGVTQSVPRRFVFANPIKGTTNYENQLKRLEEMRKDPDFGDIANAFGRVWWDRKTD
ncbi:MAG: SusD/RagB family nutrient-binding outer membrane lipoprotein [Tannerella sp.]|jgi:hypothetical protein|nr:SusD/RagB family nutrient-binding outer membrane lipoprotein [Tannerella sp.]